MYYTYPTPALSNLKRVRLRDVPEGGLFYPNGSLYQSRHSGVKGCLFLVIERDRGHISVEIREGPHTGEKKIFWHEQWVKLPAEENI